MYDFVVGIAGFEPAVSRSQAERLTKLAHIPITIWRFLREQARIVVSSLRKVLTSRLILSSLLISIGRPGIIIYPFIWGVDAPLQISPIFSMISITHLSPRGGSYYERPEAVGFEPTNAGIKTQCVNQFHHAPINKTPFKLFLGKK